MAVHSIWGIVSASDLKRCSPALISPSKEGEFFVVLACCFRMFAWLDKCKNYYLFDFNPLVPQRKIAAEKLCCPLYAECPEHARCAGSSIQAAANGMKKR